MAIIAETLAKAMNDEILSGDVGADWPKIEHFLLRMNQTGVARYWTTAGVAEITELLNTEPWLARFVLGFSERFMMLMHQGMEQEPLVEVVLKADTRALTRPKTSLGAMWWTSVVDSIIELRAIFQTSTTLSRGMSASLTFPSEDLRKTIKANYWLVVLYLAMVNGTFVDLKPTQKSENDNG